MNEKEKALEQVLAQIEKDFGKGAIMRLGDSAGDTNIEVIPTGCLSLDLALGVGGMPRGRIVEIYGPESSGKTTIALHVVAEAQKLGGEAAFIDFLLSAIILYYLNVGCFKAHKRNKIHRKASEKIYPKSDRHRIYRR